MIYYFQFDANKWLSAASKIQLLSYEEKGIFIELCAMILLENGKIKNDEILARKLHIDKQKLSNWLNLASQLELVSCKDDFLSVKFIDAFLKECSTKSYILAQNGKLGGLKSAKKRRFSSQAKPLLQKEKEKEKENNKEKELEEERVPAPPEQKNSFQPSIFDPRINPPTAEQVCSEAANRGIVMTIQSAEAFIEYWQGMGWETKGGYIRDWRFKLKSWQERGREIEAGKQAKEKKPFDAADPSTWPSNWGVKSNG